MKVFFKNILEFSATVAQNHQGPAVFAAMLIVTAVLYGRTMMDVPRSDHLIFFINYKDLPLTISNLPKIMFLEFFGDPRFQPLAFFLQYVLIKVFGTNFFLYHLNVVILHALNSVLLFLLLRSLTRNSKFAFIVSLIFVSLFTHVEIIAWPTHFYILLQVSMSLLALNLIFAYHRGRGRIFLYSAYLLAFVQQFLYEPGVLFPLMLFLFPFFIRGKLLPPNHIKRSLFLLVAVYCGFVALYAVFVAAFPQDIASGQLTFSNVLRGLSGVPVHFFNTIFMHNMMASARVVFDELLFFAPFDGSHFVSSVTTTQLILLNFAVFIALAFLALMTKKPDNSNASWMIWLLVWGTAYSFIIMLGRIIQEAITQSRYAYFPALAFWGAFACFLEPRLRFSSLLPRDQRGGRLASIGVMVVLLLLIGINIFKTWNAVTRYEDYVAYTNKIYYSARSFISDPKKQDKTLMIGSTTYPPHEKLAWCADIVPDLFLSGEPRITKDFGMATDILKWSEELSAPIIIKRPSPSPEDDGKDFSLTFGIMPHGFIHEDYLEIFAPLDSTEGSTKRWFVHLEFKTMRDKEGDTGQFREGLSGKARVVLGYYRGARKGVVFSSEPIPIQRSKMTQIILVRQNGEFGIIANGTLIERVSDVTEEDYTDIGFTLGKIYRMDYRKPYYFAHTLIEIGNTQFSIGDKKVGYIFPNIRFKPDGFQEYHKGLFQW